MRSLTLIVLILLSAVSSAHTKGVDSTFIQADNIENPEKRVEFLIKKGWGILGENPNKTVSYGLQASVDTIAIQDFPYLKDSLYRVLAFGYGDMNNRSKALEYHLKRVKVLRDVDTLSQALASAYYETAHVFLSQNNKELALPYLEKSLEVSEAISYKTQEGQVLIDLGDIAFEVNKDKKALDYYNRAQIIFSVGDKFRFVLNYIDAKIAKVYSKIGNKNEALLYAEKAVEEVDTSISIYVDYSGGAYELAGQVFIENGEQRKGIHNLQIAQGLFERNNKFFGLPQIYKSLADAYKQVDLDTAYAYLEWYVIMNDSVINTENNNRLVQMRFEFEEEQKDKEIKMLEQEKSLSQTKQKLAEAESAKKSQSIQLFIVILMIVILLLIASIYLFRNSRKQNRLVNKQKQLVEERNKEIEDSITYAKRIQRAVIPEQSRLTQLFPESFCFYLPKDGLSGDFYWVYEVETNDGDNLNLFAVGDCTGHGIPGALLSVLGVNYLNLGAVSSSINNTGEALDYLDKGIIHTFGHSTEMIRDGMDIVIGAIDPISNTLYYSCAKNVIYIVREGEITVLKGDKKAIGNDIEQKAFSFATNVFQLHPGDMLYALSDGYQDQFGGAKGKKYKVKPLRDLLTRVANQPMIEQEVFIKKHFYDWKGSFEQVDDVTLLAIRIT